MTSIGSSGQSRPSVIIAKILATSLSSIVRYEFPLPALDGLNQ